MRIGVNTRLLLKGKLEGIGYFTFRVLESICKKHRDVEFVFFFDRPYDKEFVFSDNIKPVLIPLPARHPLLWQIYFDLLLPVYCRLYGVDLFFSPENYLPKISSIPTICTIHDINFAHDNSFIGDGSHQRYFLKYFPLNARKASAIATVSQYSKQDIAKTWNIDPDKISVVYCAANVFEEDSKEYNENEVKEKYSRGKDYFYFVGAISQRKNLQGVFRAFDLFKDCSLSETKLIVIGNKKWWSSSLEEAYCSMRHKDDVVFTGRLSSQEIAHISKASLALVFPSFFEGFGMPVVEAFHYRTAVITSDRTSLPEIAQGAAVLTDPYNIESVAKAMITIYNDKSLREKLIEKGTQRATFFTWDKTADRLWTIIERYKK